MKKIILILGILSVCAFGFADFSMTLDFVYENTAYTARIDGGSYNFVTNHYYASPYNIPSRIVGILNSDGTDTGNSLNVTGLTMGSLYVFSIAVDAAGVIYAGTDTAPSNLFRWASEADTAPTQQAIAEVPFFRVMDIKGTGASTVIATTGNADDAPTQILTTADGTTFAVTEAIPGTPTILGIKNGIAVNAAGTVIWGNQGYGTPPSKAAKVLTDWVQDTSTWLPNNTDLHSPVILGYWDERDILLGLSTNETDDAVVAMDGTTGALLDHVHTGKNIITSGYGAIDQKTTIAGGEARFIVRNFANNGYIAGKVTLSYPTPTPTPIVNQANSSWGLYE